MGRLAFSVLVVAAFLAGCGARTDDLEPGTGFGFGFGGFGGGDSGGADSRGGVDAGLSGGGTAARGSGGRGVGAGGGIGPGRGGTAGCAGNNCGIGGVSPGGGSAGAAQCSYPSCVCGDCMTSCLCTVNSPDYCKGNCFPGTGGTTGGFCTFPNCDSCKDCESNCVCSGNDPKYCASACSVTKCQASSCPAQNIPVIANPFPGCCTQWGTCGVDLSQLSSFLELPSSCEERNQPFGSGSKCPDDMTSFGTTFVGCCRPEGVCGVDMSVLGIGCARTVSSSSISCGQGGTGGAGGQGGFGNSGGGVAVGGSVSAGGSPSVSACLSEARSDCERCACNTCTNDYVTCFGEDACPEILQCLNQTQCALTNCYTPATCQTVIDKYGLSSPAIGHAANLLLCLQQNSCACGFGTF